MINKYRMAHIITIMSVMLFIVLGLASGTTAPATNTGNSSNRQASTQSQPSGSSGQGASSSTASSSYFTGNGGRGMRLGIIVPESQGLGADQAYIPAMVQGVLVSTISKYSSISVLDRVSLDRVITETLDPAYQDNLDIVRLGHVAQVGHMMTGKIIRTSTGYTLQLNVTDTTPDAKTLASYSGTCTVDQLDDQTAIQKASQDLLAQMGVQLTSTAMAELNRAGSQQSIGAEAALARGITAQRQGTEVAALSYFFQAASLNPTLLEAANRSSILNANISSGNIGEDVRNDIVWRRNWVGRLTEAEQSFAEFNRTESMRYTLFYSDEIKQGAVNYQNETVTLSIETNLHPSHTWGRSVGLSMQRTLRAVYDGLQATKRTSDWSLNSWPNRGVTNLNSFARQEKNFTIAAELLNDRNQVIGRQSFQAGGNWRFTYNGNAPSGIEMSNDDKTTVNFTVKADDITNRLTIRIASVNGVDAEIAARNGVLQIRAMPKSEYDRNMDLNSRFKFALGEIKGPGPRFDFEQEVTGSGPFRASRALLSIPPSIWNDPVVSIGVKAFDKQVSSDHSYISIYLPDSVTYIGERAFYIYYYPDGNRHEFGVISSIRIGANVTMVESSFGASGGGFALYLGSKAFMRAYKENNMMAGIYYSNMGVWTRDR